MQILDTEGTPSILIFVYRAIMNCRNQKECKIKSENWIKNQDKFVPIGEKEFESFYTKYKKGNAVLEFDKHFSKRCFERSITDSNIKQTLKFGWVIERNKSMEQVSLVVLCYVGKYYRPIHLVFSIIDESKWVAVTAYTPLSHSWKWSDDFMSRICFCDCEDDMNV